jgi:hypothetical protein
MDPKVPFRFCHRTLHASYENRCLRPRSTRCRPLAEDAPNRFVASGSRRAREDTPFAGGHLAFHLSISEAETPAVVETGARHLSSPPDGAPEHGDARRPATMTIERSRTFV